MPTPKTAPKKGKKSATTVAPKSPAKGKATVALVAPQGGKIDRCARGKIDRVFRCKVEAEVSETLRSPQVYALRKLATAKVPLGRKSLAAKPSGIPGLTEYLGSTDAKVRAQNDLRKGFRSLLSLGAVTVEKPTEGNGVAYRITATGRKLLAAVKKIGK